LASGEIRIRPLSGIAEVGEGDDLGRLVVEAGQPQDGEIVVLSQKVVSKSEGRLRRLDQVQPGAEAIELASRLDKDPRIVELVLAESARVLRAKRGVLITETAGGWICANAGIDSSNVGKDGVVALLPLDADASARRIRAEIAAADGGSVGVVIADSFGRPWRLGQADVAIGCAGVIAVEDWRGRHDHDGRELTATEIALADELAAAADLVRAKDSGLPGAILSGLAHLVTADDGPGAAALRRPAAEDLFR
jgi:coenzyme F420-0:L-glutamate ligase/coenzyme F420-1:gamma-L-glutamate ligase